MRCLVIFLSGIFSCATLLGREPVKTIEDVLNLEAKVMDVAVLAGSATVALISEGTGSSGSGVVVSEDGLILTAAHVIQGMEEVDVYFSNGKRLTGKVLGANYSKDIGMVQMNQDGPWPFVDLGKSKPLAAGDWVVAVGNSAGFDPARKSPTRFGRVLSDGPGNYFTTDATLIGGDSGGPLFDLEGRLIGINSSIGNSWKNNNHAGIDGFREDWERLLAGEAWGELEMNPLANPETPVLGIGMARGIRGVYVDKVQPNSPAAAAGMRVGDLIQSVNGEVVREGSVLQQILYKHEGGDEVEIGVLRGGRDLSFKVTLVKREEMFR